MTSQKRCLARRNSTQEARGQGTKLVQGPQLVQGASTISHQEAYEGVAVASLERTCNTPTAIAFSRLDIGNRPLHVSSDLQAVNQLPEADRFQNLVSFPISCRVQPLSWPLASQLLQISFTLWVNVWTNLT